LQMSVREPRSNCCATQFHSTIKRPVRLWQSEYGDETLITTLQCVTQTTNNRPGMLSHEGFNMRVVEVYLLLFTAVQPFLALISPLPHPLTTRPYTVMLLVEIGPPQRKGFAS
jgi:hypothetical protein